MTPDAALLPVLLGMPYDLGTWGRKGSREGPEALRRQLRDLLEVSLSGGSALPEPLAALDRGDVAVDRYSKTASVEKMEQAVTQVLDERRAPVVVGGDHSVTLPIVRALAKAYGKCSFGLLYFDAHSDTGPPVGGYAEHHGATVRNIIEEGLVDATRIHQFGVRGQIRPGGLDYARRRGVHCVLMNEFAQNGCSLRPFGIDSDFPWYVSIDLDAIDPVYAPGVSVPVPGGLTSREMLHLMTELSAHRLVGADVVELAPAYDVADNTVLLAAHLVQELLAQGQFFRA